ncbi:hypothetical protein Tco_1184809 [Tanacetum coccineum]
MIAFLEKPEGSSGFHQIMDFLNSTHIDYALTKNPIIYVSLIHQFWQTAFASTSENGEIEITATIDGRVKTVTEASIRRHLMVDILLFPTMLVQSQISQGEGSTIPVESHHTPTSAPSTSQPLTSPPSMQTTHIAEEAATMPYDSPLPRKVESLESDLKQTKLTYGAAYTKLIMKVKKLEKTVKSSQARRRARVVVSDDEEGRDSADTEILLDQEEPTELVEDLSSGEKGEKEVSTASPEVKTAAESLVYIRRGATKRKDKGKAVMIEAEPVQEKTKLQLEVHEEANTFNAEEWDNIQAQIEADEELA